MAQKRLNKSLVIALTLTMFGCMILLSVVMLRQLQRRDPKYFVDLAEAARRQEEWQQAAVFYKQAWQRSQDAEYLVRLGDVLLQDGDVNGALIAWRQALVNQPDLLSAHRTRLDVLMELARTRSDLTAWERVLEAAEAYLQAVGPDRPEDAARARFAMGAGLVQLAAVEEGNRAKGVAELEHAAELAPETVDYALELVRVRVAEGKVDEAERLLDELSKRHASPGRSATLVRLEIARLHAARREIEAAEAAHHEAMRFAEGDPDALRDARLGYAAFLTRRWAVAIRAKDDARASARFDEAESLLRQMIDTHPDHYDAYVQLATLYQSARRPADAVAVCEQRLARGLSRKGLDASRNRLATFRLMILASEASVAAVVVDEPSDDDGREAWSRRAWQYAVDAQGEAPNHPRALSQMGRVKVSRGEYRAALEDLRAADEAYRAHETVDWEHKIILARVHLRLGESGAARAVLEDVLDQARRQRANDPIFWTVYAQALLDSDELEQARMIVDRITLDAPDYADAVRLKAAVYERLGRPGVAGRLIEEATGDAVVRALLTARQIALDEDADQALDVLRAALRTHPGDERLVSAIVQDLLDRGRADEADAVVSEAITVHPDDAQLKRLSVLTRPGLEPAERNRRMQELIESEPDEFKRDLDLVGFHLRNGELAAALGAIDGAARHLIEKDTPMARNAGALQHHALLKAKVRIAGELGNDAALDEARDAAEKYNVDGVGGRTILALIHLARGDLDPAVSAFRSAIALQPTDAWSLTHLAQCLHRLGALDEASQTYQRALQVMPHNGPAHKGLALLARARNDERAFEEHFAACQKEIPGDAWVQRESRARAEQADPADAIRRREAELAESDDDVDNLLRLAELCDGVGERDKADGYYDRARALRPDDADIAATVADYFRRTERPERALKLLTAFADDRSTVPERSAARLLIARHYVATGDLENAEATLLQTTESGEDETVVRALAQFYLQTTHQMDRALPWLDRAVELARASASPRLAAVLQARVACLLHPGVNNPQRTAQAQRDIAELRDRFPDDPRSRLWESQLHARAGDIDAAVADLTDYLRARPADPPALYQRAQHRITQGRLVPAMEDLETLRQIDPFALELKPRRLLARLYLRTGQKDRWLHELESLADDAPDAPDICEELINAYLAEGRAVEADRLVTARINRADGAAEARWLVLRGRVSIEMGELSKALEDFGRAAVLSAYSAEAFAEVLDVYARIGRFAEGVAYYDQHAPVDPPGPILRARYAVLLARTRRLPEAADAFRAAMAQAAVESSDAVRAITGDLYRAFPTPAAKDEAIELFERRTGDDGLDRGADRVLIRLYRERDRFDAAAVRLDRLIDTAPDDRRRAALLHEKGDILHTAGDPQAARTLYEEALKYDGDNWVTLNNLAYLLSDDLNEAQAALPYARRAVALVDSASALDTLGWIYVGLGDYTTAIAELSRALRHDPDAALTLYHLGEAYRRNAQFTEAIDVLESARAPARIQGNDELLRDIERAIERSETRQDRP